MRQREQNSRNPPHNGLIGKSALRRWADGAFRPVKWASVVAIGTRRTTETIMSHLFTHPLPWYVAGPLIGLVVPALLLLVNKPFGISSNFRHLYAALAPCGI